MSKRTTQTKKSKTKSTFPAKALVSELTTRAKDVAEALQPTVQRVQALLEKTPLPEVQRRLEDLAFSLLPGNGKQTTTGKKRRKAADVLQGLPKSFSQLSKLPSLRVSDIKATIENLTSHVERAWPLPSRAEITRIQDQLDALESRLSELKPPKKTAPASTDSTQH